MYPVMIPLGSSGGDHMIFTVLEVTSGNQSLTGGPGTEISDQRHYCITVQFNLFRLNKTVEKRSKKKNELHVPGTLYKN